MDHTERPAGDLSEVDLVHLTKRVVKAIGVAVLDESDERGIARGGEVAEIRRMRVDS